MVGADCPPRCLAATDHELATGIANIDGSRS